MKLSKWILILVTLAFAGPAIAQQTVNQGQGQSAGSKPWVVSIGGSSGSGGVTVTPGKIQTGAPFATVATSAVSARAAGLTGGACYRVACSAATYFRTGIAVPVAVTTDNQFFGPAVEKICLPTTDNAIAFVNAAGTGVCTVASLN